jgi:hypothetical protein
VDYVFGLARNDRLEQAIVPELITATIKSIRTCKTARCFKDFSYATLSTWSRQRRVIGKAEVTGGEANPRFIVTSLKRSEAGARHLYEKINCARGDKTAPRPRPCKPTSSGCGLPRWLTYCCPACAASGWRTHSLPRPEAARENGTIV